MIIDIQNLENVYASLLPAQEHDFWSALQNISIAHREGKHLLVASPEASAVFDRGKDQMDPKAVAILHKCARDFSQTVGLLNSTDVLEYIAFGNTLGRHGKAIEVPWHYFSDSGFVQATAVIAENAADIEFYKLVAEAWLRQKRLHVQLSVQQVPGGGSTTYQIADIWYRGRRSLCLCILDSDRCSPQDALGGTAAKVRATLPSPTDVFFRLYILDECREAENLISPDSYRKIYPLACGSFGLIEQRSELWNFADLKNGTLGHSVLQNKNPSTVAYWTTFLALALCPAGSCSTKQNCKCSLGEPVPGDIGQTASRLAKISPERRRRDLTPWSPQLEAVAALVSAWTMAPKPTYA